MGQIGRCSSGDDIGSLLNATMEKGGLIWRRTELGVELLIRVFIEDGIGNECLDLFFISLP
jgi:hypothetical protein